MNHLPTLISDLALIMICAGIITILFKKLKQPVVLGYILAGILVGILAPLVKTFINKSWNNLSNTKVTYVEVIEENVNI